jgi:peptidoglycan hydrolase CwlO-like protein
VTSHRIRPRARASLALVTALLLAAPAPASAESSTQSSTPATLGGAGNPATSSAPAGGDLADARSRLTGLQAEIAGHQASVEELLLQMRRVSTELGRERAAYAHIQARLGTIRNELATVEREHAGLRERLDERAAEALYATPGSTMEFLLESDSFAEISDRIEFLTQLQVADAALAEQVEAAAARLASRRDELESALRASADVVAKLDVHEAQLGELLADEQERLSQITRARQEATSLIEQLVAQRKERRAAQATAISDRLASLGGAVAPYGQWARLFLQAIGAPTCHQNLVVLVAWQAAEGTLASWNPLATTLQMPGSIPFNSVGVQNYTSLAQGLEAIHQTLLRGSETYGYGAILTSLGRCADAMTTAQAVNASSWCRGCTGGAYVTGLVPVVEAYFETYAADVPG